MGTDSPGFSPWGSAAVGAAFATGTVVVLMVAVAAAAVVVADDRIATAAAVSGAAALLASQVVALRVAWRAGAGPRRVRAAVFAFTSLLLSVTLAALSVAAANL